MELVQKNNAELKGKSEAFARFRDILAEDLIKMMPEMNADVRRVQSGGPVQLEGSSHDNGNAG